MIFNLDKESQPQAETAVAEKTGKVDVSMSPEQWEAFNDQIEKDKAGDPELNAEEAAIFEKITSDEGFNREAIEKLVEENEPTALMKAVDKTRRVIGTTAKILSIIAVVALGKQIVNPSSAEAGENPRLSPDAYMAAKSIVYQGLTTGLSMESIKKQLMRQGLDENAADFMTNGGDVYKVDNNGSSARTTGTASASDASGQVAMK